MAAKLNILWAILLATALGACSTHSTPPPGDGVDAEAGDADAALADVDAKADADSAIAADADTHLDGAETPDVDANLPDGATAADADAGSDIASNCPGGPFCDCKTDTECDSGKCLETPNGHTCAPTCVEAGCPSGYACKPLGGGDPLNYCVANHLSLCAPCATNKDCQAQGVTDALCLDYGDVGHFCGGTCAIDGDCGDGYSCVDAPDPVGGGKTVKQCKAKAAVCGCSVWAKTAGTLSNCANSNSAGTCKGTRTCGSNGLSACSAKVPAPESCNNQDDDCNGSVDDLPVDATCANSAYAATGSGAPCSKAADCTVSGEGCDASAGVCHALIGTCTGKQVCQSGVAACIGAKTPKVEDCNGEDDNCDGATDEGFGWSDPIGGGNLGIGSACGTGLCAGGSVVCASFQGATCSTASKATAEDCNGIDDNCNGSVDENTCSDSNPCTADLCAGGNATCQHLAVEAGCDDGNPCTLADACSNTACNGTPVTCDDSNPCTSDTCDPKTGACVFANQAGSCTDGNACTSGDACGAIAGGGWGCLAGGVIDCNDANPCTDDSCSLSSGCTYTSNNFAQSCYDGPDGTAGKGLCHSGLRYCSGGVLDATCKDEVLPVTPEPCNGLDDSCDGFTDEGCAAATVTLSFAAAQTAGKSGALTANVLLAADRPAIVLQDSSVPHKMALGVFAWFVHLLTGN